MSSSQLGPGPPRPNYYKEIKDLVYLSQLNMIWLPAALPGLLPLSYRASAYVKINKDTQKLSCLLNRNGDHRLRPQIQPGLRVLTQTINSPIRLQSGKQGHRVLWNAGARDKWTWSHKQRTLSSRTVKYRSSQGHRVQGTSRVIYFAIQTSFKIKIFKLICFLGKPPSSQREIFSS